MKKISKNQGVNKNLRNLIKTKDGHITMLQDSLKDKEEEILMLKTKYGLKLNPREDRQLNDFDTKIKHEVSTREKHINELKKRVIEQHKIIGEVKGSIVYPLFLITKRLGKTKLGDKIGHLLKR